MTTQTQSFLQGEIVDGKYHLRQYLGGSDHGAVFLTEHGNLRPQKAAIKLVRVRPGNAELQLSRWRLAANLAHPHLVRIFDMGRCELENSAMLYVVMELADENLAQIIPERALTPDEARDMLAPVLDALAYMHGRGFVHGHIKPSNIMAVGEELKVSSDGICRLADAIESPGLPGVYDPPEGTRNGAAPAGDVWSLGATLVEVLTQQPLALERGGAQGTASARSAARSFRGHRASLPSTRAEKPLDGSRYRRSSSPKTDSADTNSTDRDCDRRSHTSNRRSCHSDGSGYSAAKGSSADRSGSARTG